MKTQETSTTTTTIRYSEQKENGIHLDAVLQQPDCSISVIYSDINGQGTITLPAKYLDVLCTFISDVRDASSIVQEPLADYVEPVPTPPVVDPAPTVDPIPVDPTTPVVDSP